MLRRQAKEGMERRRDMILAALWANSNYDQKEEIRPELSASIDEMYSNAIKQLYGEKMPEQTDLPDTAFFRASPDWKGDKRDGKDAPAPDANLLDIDQQDGLQRFHATEDDDQ